MISPVTLTAAGFLGVALHRSDGMTGLRIIALLEEANAGLRQLLVVAGKTRDPPN